MRHDLYLPLLLLLFVFGQRPTLLATNPPRTCGLAQKNIEATDAEAVITGIFDGMRRADTSGMRDLFLPGAQLNSIVTHPDGTTRLQAGLIDDWLAGIAKAAPGDYDERVPYIETRYDGHLATAWVPYVFYLKGEIHHCGTNAFQLVRQDDVWRVLQITDTRRDGKGDCRELPQEQPDARAAIDSLASRWHRAAAEADSSTFFDAIADDGYYLGTDKGEHWTKQEFLGFAAPYFARGKAWAFTATERHLFYDKDSRIAWWDEVLATWMGPCRGTGVVERTADGEWKIKHYTLSMLVPNERVEQVIEAIGK